MKKKILLSIIAFISIISLYTIKSEATFKISDFQINCFVRENGDMDVEENITYYTNENKNGLIRNVETKNSMNSKNSAENFILQKVLVDKETYKQTSSAYVGQNGVYTYKKSNDSYEIKVFSPFNSNYKTVTYHYKLTNVAVKYNDIAEMYWNFIGDEWDCPINNLTINLYLPKEAGQGDIYVYGHGSDNGTFNKIEHYVQLKAYDIEAYQSIDARILFPTSAVSASTKTVNKNVLNKYINEEEGMSTKKEAPEVFIGFSVKEIALAISGIILISGIVIYFKYDKEYKVEKYKYFREKPYNLEPEILQRIYYGKNTKNAFWITFLNLIKKGVFKIEKTTNEVGKQTEKIVFNENGQKLKEYQEIVRDQIKRLMGTGKTSIDMLKLEAKMRTSTSNWYSKFTKALNAEYEGLFGEIKKAPKKLITTLAISMAALIALITVMSFITSPDGIGIGIAMFLGMTALVYSIFFATVGSFLPALIFIIFHCGAFQIGNFMMLSQAKLAFMYIPYVLLFILIQYVIRVKKNCKEERQIREQVKGLRRFLRDYSYLSDKEDVMEIALWEDYFILAVALGLNKKSINEWYNYGENFISSNLEASIYCVGGYNYMESRMRPAFSTYTHAAVRIASSGGRSSYSGSSGGFSGGSSSGGGGRRRWRRKFLLKSKHIKG